MDTKNYGTRISKWFVPLVLVLTVFFTACADTSTSISLSELPGSTPETSVSTLPAASSNSQTASSSMPASHNESDNGLEVVTKAQDLFGDWLYVDESIEVGPQEPKWSYSISINSSGDRLEMGLWQDGTDFGDSYIGEYSLDDKGILRASLQQRKKGELGGAIIKVSILAQRNADDKNSCVFTIQSIETQNKDFNASYSKLLDKPTIYESIYQ